MKKVHTIKITERMVDAGVREIEDYDCRDTSRNRDTVLDIFLAMCEASDNPRYACAKVR